MQKTAGAEHSILSLSNPGDCRGAAAAAGGKLNRFGSVFFSLLLVFA
jgi:hypothetical protein